MADSRNPPDKRKVRPGTVRRIVPYARRHRWPLLILVLLTSLHAGLAAMTPIILKFIIDDGIVVNERHVVVQLSLLIALLAVVDAGAIYLQTWFSGRIGQGLLYDLRTTVFAHIQRQPMAFFSRAQTGSLVSRLNTDVVGAQQAVTTLLSQTASVLLTLVLVLSTMFYLSWQLSLAALAMVPFFLMPSKVIGRKLQRLTRSRMQADAEMGSMMNERFNVSGAMLAKLYGRPEREADNFAGKAGSVRDITTNVMVYGQLFFIITTVLTAFTSAVVYGLGGSLVIDGALPIGTLVAMAALLMRVYGPINQLSNMQINVMTALVSFDRLFEVLDLRPLIAERADARTLPAGAPDIEFEGVSFRYPNAEDVSLASLESISRQAPERRNDTLVLRDVSFRAPAGRLTALVGLSGAGKTTITHLVPRLYDAGSGTVRIGGEDVRDLTLAAVNETVGVVTQDAHMFHDTIRANLLYARPGADERELVQACTAARIQEVIEALPDGLDTVVGDGGHRLSGGEKQRIALARLLLKSPPVVVLDEATAHLDSESEAAIQRALRTALAGRTSLVIAHRLSTIREAHQILVLDSGQIVERGTHDELLAAGGLYAELYRIQFASQADDDNEPALVTDAS
ncbi:ABC transporter ATP-binding protein [Actinoplanes sp. NPDC026619]|uniref:ABC transporter ATP-binding protein n=1 Tax=Actinoplanes sp. NPDC026619 TaxID=3155798 RepID=UPI0034028E90